MAGPGDGGGHLDGGGYLGVKSYSIGRDRARFLFLLYAAREGKASVSADASYAASDGDRLNSDSDTLNLSARAGYEFFSTFRANLLATYLKSDAGAPNACA